MFAGDGRLGFAGDGGPARDAELDLTYFSSAGMAVRPDGTVEVLDDGSCRIRAIRPDGDHPHGRAYTDRQDVSARNHLPGLLDCDLPGGKHLCRGGSTVERLSANGRRRIWVAGRQHGVGAVAPSHLAASNVLLSPDALTFDRSGDLYIANFSPKVIYKLTPAGKVTNLGWSYATQFAVTSNDGSLPARTRV